MDTGQGVAAENECPIARALSDAWSRDLHGSTAGRNGKRYCAPHVYFIMRQLCDVTTRWCQNHFSQKNQNAPCAVCACFTDVCKLFQDQEMFNNIIITRQSPCQSSETHTRDARLTWSALAARKNVAVAFVAVASLLGGRWLSELSRFFAEFAVSALGDKRTAGKN